MADAIASSLGEWETTLADVSSSHASLRLALIGAEEMAATLAGPEGGRRALLDELDALQQDLAADQARRDAAQEAEGRRGWQERRSLRMQVETLTAALERRRRDVEAARMGGEDMHVRLAAAMQLVASERAEKERMAARVERAAAAVSKLETRVRGSVSTASVDRLRRELEAEVEAVRKKASARIRKLEADNVELGKRARQIAEAAAVQVEEEGRRRAIAERKAEEAGKKLRSMAKRVKELEQQTEALAKAVRDAQEGMGVLKTIARIRETDTTRAERAIGFDALAERIDGISRTVDDRVKRSPRRRPGRPG
eukprot:PLAT12039.1.p1 GENE.PLAT12039.1~~PLAT12039.1.p1  ORF type:complete len:330 (+),score=113.19 PLAT12039.1:55-990(+)